MGVEKISSYFQILSFKKLGAKSASLALFLSVPVLLPTHPFNGGGSHRIELSDLGGGDTKELIKIYSILRLHTPDFNNRSAWAISEAILEESIKHSLDPMLVLAVINVESRFQPGAVSSKGARGLMQIRPFVAHALAEEVSLENWEGEKSLDDPIVNIKLGVFYLRYLKKRFSDLTLALTAYNWGPTKITTRLAEDEDVPLEYAMKVLSSYRSYRKGIPLPRGRG